MLTIAVCNFNNFKTDTIIRKLDELEKKLAKCKKRDVVTKGVVSFFRPRRGAEKT